MPGPEAAFLRPGSFSVGCNYWASHAGTRMWSDWRPGVVERDLALLAGAGLQVLRVFPLWPDFQPLTLLRGFQGAAVEFRRGEEPLGDDGPGRAGMSAEAMERFAAFCDMAASAGLSLVVGLLTGWMSGRLFMPPGLEGRNPLTDPGAIQWELRFVRAFVRRFRGHPAVAAWDLGNECNCMGAATREQAACWTAAVSSVIRAEDASHPVLSGMHGLSPAGPWTMRDMAEWTDCLCTHPYPLFTPHCDLDPVDTIRCTLHGAAESRYYADLGGAPCLCEETGTLGPTVAGDAEAAAFARASLFSLWANDCRGMLWWCAHDQGGLAHAPYDWNAIERELGLLRADGSAKPVLNELGSFRRFLDGFPLPVLPPRLTQAVCVLSDDQDHWATAQGAFILAKEAGFDLVFRHHAQPLPDAPLYMLPSLCGTRTLSSRAWRAIKDRVAAGADLYISMASGLPSELEETTGLEMLTRERRRGGGEAVLDGLPGSPIIPCHGEWRVNLRPTRARVLGAERDGNPVLAEAPLGRGRVVFCGMPVELYCSLTPGAFHDDGAAPIRDIYRQAALRAAAGRALSRESRLLAVTEHPVDDSTRMVVAVNHGKRLLEERPTLAPGWRWGRTVRGAMDPDGVLRVPANDAWVGTLTRG